MIKSSSNKKTDWVTKAFKDIVKQSNKDFNKSKKTSKSSLKPLKQ